jgi:hypothetical protein
MRVFSAADDFVCREETAALAIGKARRNETHITVNFDFMKLSFPISIIWIPKFG